tara:strand:+ start:262 stop:705 length:444 start_codon:yes stop_codon:yes gene_type:complete
MNIRGQLKIVLRDANGNVKESKTVENLVVNSGLAYAISRMTGTAKNVMSHMGVGSNSTAPSASDTDLGTTLGSREALDSTTITGSNNESVQYVSSFEAGDGTGAIVEAGLFNASSGGDMLCRTTFSVINKGASDTLSLTWTITLSAS